MAKFESIWGDFDIREEAVIPATKTKDEKKDPEPGADGKTPASTDGKNKKDDVDPPSNTKTDGKVAKGDDKGEGDEEDEYEYTSEDVDKAYGMLEEEGVLELAEDDEFDATPGGLADAIAATVRNKFQKEIDSIPPVVQEVYAHVMSGKDISSFTPSTVSSLDKLDMDSEADQEAVVRRLYKSQGMSDEDIQEEIDDAKEADKLSKKAGIAFKTLSTQEEAQKTAQAEAKELADKEAKEKAQKDIDGIKATIDSTEELAGFKLDDDKKAAFKDYLFKVNARTGKTQMQENMSSEDRRMQIAFLDFIDYSKADIEKQITTKLTKNRKKRLSKYSDSGTKNRNAIAIKTKVNAKQGNVTFPSIFGPQTIEVED